MSILHRILGIPAPAKSTALDQSTAERLDRAEEVLQRERQELRQKIQKVQSGTRQSARVLDSMAGAMMMVRGHESG